MDISSTAATSVQQASSPEATETHRANRQERRRDGDADNAAVQLAQQTPQATTNLQGQTIGGTINTKA